MKKLTKEFSSIIDKEKDPIIQFIKINIYKKMVKEFKNRGVKVLSYFIGDSWDREKSTSTFKKMYGDDAVTAGIVHYRIQIGTRVVVYNTTW